MLACLAVIWVGFSWVALAGHVRAVPGAHVRHHRFLSSLLFAPHLQDLARRPVHLRPAGRLGGAARSDLVGGPSSPPPCAFGQAGGRALARAARLFLEPHGLVHVAQALRGGSVAGQGFAQVSRSCASWTASTSSFRRFSESACSCSACCSSTWRRDLHTTGWQMLVWGFFISTVAGLPRHLHHQFPVACIRAPALQDRRCQPQ